MEQTILQGRAMHLRDQLGIDDELRRLGEPMLTGSAALHVRVARGEMEHRSDVSRRLVFAR